MAKWVEPMANAAAGRFQTGEDLMRSLLDKEYKPPPRPNVDFARLLTLDDPDEEWTRIMGRRVTNREVMQSREEFKTLLEKEFKPPALKKFSRPQLAPSRVRFRGGLGLGDDLVGLAQLGGELLVYLAQLEEQTAERMGLTVEEMRTMKEDAFIVTELTRLAKEIVTETFADLEKERRRKRTKQKRVRIHGFSRK